MFKTPIDIGAPDFIIDCSQYSSSLSIYESLRLHNVKQLYAYVICYKNFTNTYEALKIGQSCSLPGGGKVTCHGERLKRQLAFFPGWSDPRPRSSNSSDAWYNVQTEISLGRINPKINKDSLLVGVWNLDQRKHNVQVYTRMISDIPEWAEGELAMQYKKLHNGFLPILNYADPTGNTAYRQCNVNVDHLSKFVTFS